MQAMQDPSYLNAPARRDAGPPECSERMLHRAFPHRAVVPPNTCSAECCVGSVDSPFLKAPNWALSSFLAATSDKRDAGKGGCSPAAVNKRYENSSQISRAPDSRERMNFKKVMSVR